MNTIQKTRDYVRTAFEKRPHHSFGDGNIMFQHSVKVHDVAKYIEAAVRREGVVSDPTVVSVGALLHDIGKTAEGSDEYLHQNHGRLGYEVAKDFLAALNLHEVQIAKLEEILTETGDSAERRIIQDADIIAFYMDPKLQTAFAEWAIGRGQPEKLRSKLDKIGRLHYEASRELAKKGHEELRKKWAEYI